MFQISNLSGIMFFVFLITAAVSLPLGNRFKLRQVLNNLQMNEKRNEKLTLISSTILGMSLVLTFIIVQKRYETCLLPQGFDTAAYIYHGELLEAGELLRILRSTKTIPYLITFCVYKLCKGSLYLTGILLPFVFAYLYVGLIFATIYIMKKDFLLASLCAFFTPLTFFFVRLTYDLFGQTLVIGILLLLLSVLSKIMSRNFNVKTAVYIFILILTIFLVHAWSIFLILPFLALNIFFNILVNRSTLSKGVFIITLTFLSISSVIFVIVFSREVFWFLFSVIPTEFHFLSFHIDNWYWFVCSESFLVWLFSTIGVFFMGLKREKFDIILLLWLLYIAGMVLITGYVQSYRLLLYIPGGVYGGTCLYYLTRILYFTTKKSSKIFLLIILSTMVLATFLNTYSHAYIPAYVYYPSEQTVEQLYYIRHVYGFGNENVVVMVYTGFHGSYWWVYAITGTKVFIGSIDMLLVNGTDKFGNPIQVNNDTTVIFAIHIYGNIPPVVINYGKRITSGIYTIRYSLLKETLNKEDI